MLTFEVSEKEKSVDDPTIWNDAQKHREIIWNDAQKHRERIWNDAQKKHRESRLILISNPRQLLRTRYREIVGVGYAICQLLLLHQWLGGEKGQPRRDHVVSILLC